MNAEHRLSVVFAASDMNPDARYMALQKAARLFPFDRNIRNSPELFRLIMNQLAAQTGDKQ
jgi:hypothetical protein